MTPGLRRGRQREIRKPYQWGKCRDPGLGIKNGDAMIAHDKIQLKNEPRIYWKCLAALPCKKSALGFPPEQIQGHMKS